MIKSDVPSDYDGIVTQEIALDGEDNYIAYSIRKYVTHDEYGKGVWFTSDWVKLNTFILTGNDVKNMTHLIIYLKHSNHAYRYAFHGCKAKTFKLIIKNGTEHPIITLNTAMPHRRDVLYRYDPYIFCCGCCNTINGLDDIVDAQDPDRECIIS